MGYGSGYAPTRATIITNQAEHTAKFVKLLALEDSVVHTLTAESIDENLAGGNATNFPMGKNCCIEGLVISKIKLTSGTVIAFLA